MLRNQPLRMGCTRSEYFHLTGSKPEEIDVVVPLDEDDLEAMRRALDCYVAYAATIEESGIKRNIPREAVFEIYQEAHDPPLQSLGEGLTVNPSPYLAAR